MASSKNYTEVLIGGKVFTLSGFESEDYLQKVASYMNHKITQLSELPGYNRQPVETKHTLLSLNIADDYFKAKKMADELESGTDAKDKDIYDLKHELISSQIKLDAANQEIEKLKSELAESQKTIVKLETELDNVK